MVFTLFFAESVSIAAFCKGEVRTGTVCKKKGSCSMCGKSVENGHQEKKGTHNSKENCNDSQCVYCPLCIVILQEPVAELQTIPSAESFGFASLIIKFHPGFANEQWKPPNFSLH